MKRKNKKKEQKKEEEKVIEFDLGDIMKNFFGLNFGEKRKCHGNWKERCHGNWKERCQGKDRKEKCHGNWKERCNKDEKEETNRQEIHRHVACDGCSKTPIIGNRYKCNDCENYDLCGDCLLNKNKIHNEKHTFKTIEKSSKTLS